MERVGADMFLHLSGPFHDAGIIPSSVTLTTGSVTWMIRDLYVRISYCPGDVYEVTAGHPVLDIPSLRAYRRTEAEAYTALIEWWMEQR